ncbi:MAG: 1-acyl-sn-glycerol-3-phosphate acyltransferase [Rubrobacteraceae bacterium]
MGRKLLLSKWKLVGGLALSGLALTDRVLLPAARWYLRRRANEVIADVNERLQLKIPPFGITRRQVLIDRLLYDPEILESAEANAEEHGVPLAVVMGQVERYAREIVPAFNPYVYFKIGTRLSRILARRLYNVRVGFANEDALEKVEAQPSVVFVANHRSNMDYVLLAYLASRRTALSYAAGEWARIWPIEQLVKAMGAFFVRRGSENPLYRRVLERWVQLATEAGMVQVVFPEGGLSRDGRLREPKIGLLDYMLRRFDPVGVRDLVFIPVGLNYDRVLEDRSLLLSREAVQRSRLDAVVNAGGFVRHNLRLAVGGAWQRFGQAVVNFGIPISMREYTRVHGIDFRDMERPERIERVKTLAEELMRAVGSVVPVVPVPLVAHLFAEDPDEALSGEELKSRGRTLMADFEGFGVHVYIPHEERDAAIESGLNRLILRHLVREEHGLYRAVPEELALLRYYANSIVQLTQIGPEDETFSGKEPATAPADG